MTSAAGPETSTACPAQLHRKLSALGVLLLTLSCLSPVLSIYGIGSDVLVHAGTGAAALFVGGIGVAVVWAVIYAELGAAYPYSGGDYVSVGSILGPWAGFASLTVWAVTAGPSNAFLARTIATYVSELEPALSPDLMTFGSLLAATLFALLAVRTSAIVTGVFLVVEMLAVAVLIGAGFSHPVRGIGTVLMHPTVPGGAGAMVPVAIGALATAAVNAAYATAGGGQAIAFGEELADPHRHMGRVVLIAGVFGALATGLPVVAVVVGATDLTAVLQSAAPFSTFVAQTAGATAGHVLSAAVAIAIFNALIAQMMFFARLYYSLGRDGVFPRAASAALATVHGPSGAPRNATVALGVVSALCCLLDTHALLVFMSGLVVYSLALASLAVLYGRRRGLTGHPGYWRARLHPVAPALGLAIASVFAVADLLDPDVGRPSILLLGLLIMVGLLWHHFVVSRRTGGWMPRLG